MGKELGKCSLRRYGPKDVILGTAISLNLRLGVEWGTYKASCPRVIKPASLIFPKKAPFDDFTGKRKKAFIRH